MSTSTRPSSVSNAMTFANEGRNATPSASTASSPVKPTGWWSSIGSRPSQRRSARSSSSAASPCGLSDSVVPPCHPAPPRRRSEVITRWGTDDAKVRSGGRPTTRCYVSAVLTMGRAVASAATAMAIGAALAGPAAAAPQPQPYRANDAGGFRNLLPPGTNGLANIVELAAFQATGARPPHNDDQYALYRDLLYAAPGHRPGGGGPLLQGRRASACAPGTRSAPTARGRDVTIVRDRGFGVPHIYADSRAAALWAVGYVSAEDRLFFMDIFRHLGRARLSAFAGGAPANRAFDRLVWKLAPYTEDDLQRQIEARPRGLRARVRRAAGGPGRVRRGHQRLHRRGPARTRSRCPASTRRSNRPAGPRGLEGHRRGGHGGGDRRDLRRGRRPGGGLGAGARGGARALRPRAGRAGLARLPPRRRPGVAARSCTGGRFPYGLPPRKPSGAWRFPTAGPRASTRSWPRRRRRASAGARRRRALLAFPEAQSNALLVSARESASGRPLAVFGPQTAYFSPQVLMEMDVHAPGHRRPRRRLPGRQPLRADRARTRLRVERHDVGAGHRGHLRPAPVRGGRRPAHARLDALPLPRTLPADRGARAHQRVAAEPRGLDAGGPRDAQLPAHRDGAGGGAGDDPRPPYIYTRLRTTYRQEPNGGPDLPLAQRARPGARPARLPAHRLARPVHLQLVLHRQAATSPTRTPGPTRSARAAPTPACRSSARAATSGADGTRRPTSRPTPPAGATPT